MAIIYPMLKIGAFKLGLGFNYSFLNHKWGFDLDKRFHRDPDYRIATIMAIDKAVYKKYGCIGLGFKEPFPRPSVEPFGHRFIPAMFGCPCRFKKDIEPWAKNRIYSDQEIMSLPQWTLERFEQLEPVKETVRQAKYLHEKYGYFSSLPNLGSVINTAIYLLGDNLFIKYIDAPHIVNKLYDNITQLMLLCTDFFPKLDGKALSLSFIGNCSVSMISPADYKRCNYQHDERFMSYCRSHGMSFCMHQDSGATPHLKNYAELGRIDTFDVGMDTDFEQLNEFFPNASVNCILFPHWLISHSMEDIKEEISRLVHIGKKFKSFSFSLFEIDLSIEDDLLFGLYEIFHKTL